MAKYDFHPLLLQYPDALDGLLSPGTIGMNAAYLAMNVMPLSNLPLPTEDSPVVAGIAGEIDPPPLAIPLTNKCKKVDMAGKMTRCVDNIYAAVLENVHH